MGLTAGWMAAFEGLSWFFWSISVLGLLAMIFSYLRFREVRRTAGRHVLNLRHLLTRDPPCVSSAL
jgi:hypothetical protein